MRLTAKNKIAFSLATVMTCSLLTLPISACSEDPRKGNGKVQGTTKESTALLNGMLEQQFSAISIQGQDIVTDTSTYYITNKNGVRGEVDYELTTVTTLSENTKYDLRSGNLDSSSRTHRKDFRGFDGVIERKDTFVRDGHTFTHESGYEENEIESWDSNVTLDYNGNFLEVLNEAGEKYKDITDLFSFVTGESLSENLSDDLHFLTYTFTKLADSFGGLTIEGDKATIDFNATVYGIKTKLYETLASFDQFTTIGELLATDAFRDLFMSVTELVTIQDIHDVIGNVYERLPEESVKDIDLSKIFPSPKKGSTTYDYLIKVFETEELGICDVRLKSLLEKSGISPDELADTFLENTQSITEDSVTVNPWKSDYGKLIFVMLSNLIPTSSNFPYTDIVFSDTTIEYTLSENNVTGQKIAATVTASKSEYDNEQYTVRVSSKSVIDYSTNDLTFTDISNCATSQYAERYVDGAALYFYNLETEYNCTIKQTVRDNKIVGFTLSDAAGNMKTLEIDQPFTIASATDGTIFTISFTDIGEYTKVSLKRNNQYFGSSSAIKQQGHLLSTVKDVLNGNKGTFKSLY